MLLTGLHHSPIVSIPLLLSWNSSILPLHLPIFLLPLRERELGAIISYQISSSSEEHRCCLIFKTALIFAVHLSLSNFKIFLGPVPVNDMQIPPILPPFIQKFAIFAWKMRICAMCWNDSKINFSNLYFLRYGRFSTQNSQNLPSILTLITDQKC